MLTPLNAKSIDNSAGWLAKLQRSLKFFLRTTRAASFLAVILKFTGLVNMFSHRSTRCKATTHHEHDPPQNTTICKAPTTSNGYPLQNSIPFEHNPPPNTTRPIAKLNTTRGKSTVHSAKRQVQSIISHCKLLKSFQQCGGMAHLPCTFFSVQARIADGFTTENYRQDKKIGAYLS